MGDIKLFRVQGDSVAEMEGVSVAVEKSLQVMIERHLETFLGIRFLATEYSTGKAHQGRIDTLGLDENNFPVIIEYKRAVSENVVNQGLYYLDWLMDHRGDFELLTMKKFGQEISSAIDWSAPRLLCIAGDFKKYDEHAVNQIHRNIELIRYKRFGDDLVLFDLVNSVHTNSSAASTQTMPSAKPNSSSLVEAKLEQSPVYMKNWFESLRAYLQALGDDVQMKTLKHYFAFSRLKNFACVEIYPQKKRILIYLKVNPDSIVIEPGFTRDVRAVGHYGTGDLEVIIDAGEDLDRAHELILKSYESA